MNATRIKNQVLALVLTIAALAVGQTAWAASEFTVTNTAGTSKFVITRTTNTLATETVSYRTVSLSAIAELHFTDKTGSLTFDATHNSYEVEVTEKTPGSGVDAFKYQNSASRSYRFEVLDQGGFRLAYADRDITTGTQFTNSYLNKTVTDLVYFDNSGNIQSGSGNKYKDVSYSSSSWKQVTDGGYKQGVHTVSITSLFNNSNSTLRTRLDDLGYKIYATVYFTQMEEYDGYQYIQILADNASTYDGDDSNGTVSTPKTSLYKACFILSYDPSGSVMSDAHYQFFPHRYDYVDKATEIKNSITHYEFDYDNSHLYKQAFKSDGYKASTSGSLVLNPTVNNLNIRFDAAGSDKDTWDFKNLKVRLALVDGNAPTLFNKSNNGVTLSGGKHAKGNTFYVSIPFNEIVTVSGTPTLSTTWGTIRYTSGSGSNVLTFAGTITADAGTALTVNTISGTIKDLAGNEFSSKTINKNFGVTVDASNAYLISYTLGGGTLPAGYPATYTYDAATTLLNPTRTGYDFTGWTGSNGTTLNTAVTIPAGSMGDKSYTANWTTHTYPITFDLAGGSVATANPETYTIESGNFTLVNPTREGYTFAGWTGTGLTAPTQTVTIPTGSMGDRTYTATWTADSYTLTYDLAGGSVATANPATYTIESGAITLTNPTREGYTFAGWTGSNGDTPQTSVTIPKGSTGNRSYTANWTANSYTITYDPAGGSLPSNSPTNYTIQSDDFILYAPNREGYTFLGWTGSNGDTPQISVTVPKGTTGELSYTANWSIIYYTITYRNTDGAEWPEGELHPDSYTIETPTFTIGRPTKTGYTFYQWTDNNTTIHKGYIGNRQFTAIWHANSYSIHFDANATQGIPATGTMINYYYLYNTEKNLPANAFTRTGYTFAGWNTKADGTGTAYTDGQSVLNLTTENASTVTLYAQWQVIPWEGSGTSENDPYLIQYASQLLKLADDVNSNTNYNGKYFKLANDIDMAGVDFGGIGGDNSFNGIFDGDNKTVSNVTISKANKTYVGFFGSVYLGTVQNLILDGASITGNLRVGALVGWLYDATLHNCLVVNSTVKGDSNNKYIGVITGTNSGTITSNYYRNCTLNEAGVNVGVGNNVVNGEGGPSDRDGARSIHTLTRPNDVTVSGTETKVIGGKTYYAAGSTVTLTSGSGTELTDVTVNGTAATNNNGTWSFTMPAADATVNCGNSVTYIAADGTPQICTGFTRIESSNSDVVYGTADQEGWFVVSGDVTINGVLTLKGSSQNLILCDGATLTVNSSGRAINSAGNSSTLLTLYGQVNGNGTIHAISSGDNCVVCDGSLIINDGTIHAETTANEYGIYTIKNFTVNGGSITASGGSTGIHVMETLIINGGNVAGNSSGNDGIYATSFVFNGGNVSGVSSANSYDGISCGRNGTATLGHTSPDDRLYASSYNGAVSVKEGKYLSDGTAVYSGTLTTQQKNALKGKTLQPCFGLTLPEHVNATAGAMNSNNALFALPGATVTLTPDAGYALTDVTVNDNAATAGSDGTWSFAMPGESATVSASATATGYTLTYDLAGGSVATDNPATYTVESGAITLTNPTRTGYTFAGWTGTDLNAPTKTVTIATSSTGNRSYTATWTADSYTLTYNLAGGDVATANPATYTIETSAITLNNPTRTGYTFAGWTGTDLDAATTTVTIAQGSMGNRSYTATWTAVSNTLTYDLAGGTADNPATYTIEGDAITLTNPTREHYTFAGWTGTGLTEPTLTVTIPAGSTGNRSYTATWTPVAYAISYELAGGSVATANPATYTIESSDFTLTNPTRPGYTFAGWTGTGLTEATPTVTIAQGSTGARSYTATWTTVSFAINYDLAGGSVATANPATYTVESGAITLTNPTREHYTFAGWTGTGLDAATTTVTIATGSSGVRSYTATWTPVAYTISFDLAGGSVASANPVSYTIESGDITLTNPTGTYPFMGWTGTDLDKITQTVTIPAGSTGNRSYTAHWMEPVAYIDADGTSQTCTDYTLIESSNDNQVYYHSAEGGSWYVVSGNVTVNTIWFEDYDAHLILKDGATLTMAEGRELCSHDNVALTIYGQTEGTGTIVGNYMTANNGLTINGGTLNINNTSTSAIQTLYYSNIVINRGTVTTSGIYHAISASGALTINGGTVTATNTANYHGSLFALGDVYINGGIVTATAPEGYYALCAGYDYDSYTYGVRDIYLNWTNTTDRLTASSYGGTVAIYRNKPLEDESGNIHYPDTNLGFIGFDNHIPFTEEQKAALAGKTLKPFTDDSRTFNIAYEVNGGTMPATYPETYTYFTTVELPVPTRDDYTFIGWCTNAQLTSGHYTQIDAQTLLGDRTFYAEWGPKYADVAYIDENGEKKTAHATILYGGSGVNGSYPGGIYTTSDYSVFKTLHFSGDATIIIPDGGNLNIFSESDGTISADGNLTFYGQKDGDDMGFVISRSTTATGNIAIYGGCGYVAYDGVTANSGSGTITLGWTGVRSYLYVKEYNGTVTLAKKFMTQEGDVLSDGEVSDNTTINGKGLTPYIENMDVSYIDENGTEHTVNATVLHGKETNLEGGIYTVMGDVYFYTSLSFGGNTTIVVPDDIDIEIEDYSNWENDCQLQGNGITVNGDLAIYGQTMGKGGCYIYALGDALHATGKVTIANVKIGLSGVTNSICSGGDILLTGVEVEAYGTLNANSGSGTITLDWRKLDDRIYASGYNDDFAYNGQVTLAKPFINPYADSNDGKVIPAGAVSDNATVNGVYLYAPFVLADDSDNEMNIALNAFYEVYAMLYGRTLYKDGAWNTLCLPFNLDAEALAASPLAGCTLMEMDVDDTYDDQGHASATGSHQTGFDDATGTLYLYFKEATSISAGKPYIIKWASGENIVNPLFSNVTLNSGDNEVSSSDGSVSFVGSYKPVTLVANDHNTLFLGAGNKLYWPNADMTIGAFRACFKLSDGTEARQFVLGFGGDEVTSIDNSQFTIDNEAGAWYTLDGRKLDGKPSKKGLYIHNGRKTVIK